MGTRLFNAIVGAWLFLSSFLWDRWKWLRARPSTPLSTVGAQPPTPRV